MCVFLSVAAIYFTIFLLIKSPDEFLWDEILFRTSRRSSFLEIFRSYSVQCLLCLRGCCCCCWWGHNKLTSVATRVSLYDGICVQAIVIENSVQLYRQDNWVGDKTIVVSTHNHLQSVSLTFFFFFEWKQEHQLKVKNVTMSCLRMKCYVTNKKHKVCRIICWPYLYWRALCLSL